MELQELLTECAKRKASDLHLKAGSRPILRIHGHLEMQDDLAPVSHDFVRRTAMTLLGEHRFGMLMEGKEMDVGYLLPGLGRFRVNMFLSQGEVRGVFRHVPQRIPAFQELHMPKVLDRLCMERRGMILVTGITGSGKSTTLAAIIDFVNKNRNDHIITIEDPIEFVHEDNKCVISQREVGQDSASFATALRAALREDPDIILVGEMRDAETMEVALHAAETGHLVLSTLHTLNATETVNRIISTFPPHQEDQIRDQLASVMQGIVSQRLVVRADGKGRVPAVEVMVGTGLIRDSIRTSEKTSNIPTAIAAGQAQYGMQTFDQSLLQLHREELITYETARDAATNPDDFDLKVKGILSTGEMTWERRRRARCRRRRPRRLSRTPRRRAAPSGSGDGAGPALPRRGGRAAGARRQGGAAGGRRSSRAKGVESARAHAAPRAARRPRRRGRGRRGRARGTGLSRRRGLCPLVGPGARAGTAGRQHEAPPGAPRQGDLSRAGRRRRRRGVRGDVGAGQGPRCGPAPARGALPGEPRAGPGPAGRLSAAPRLSAVGGSPGGQGAPRRRRGRGDRRPRLGRR